MVCPYPAARRPTYKDVLLLGGDEDDTEGGSGGGLGSDLVPLIGGDEARTGGGSVGGLGSNKACLLGGDEARACRLGRCSVACAGEGGRHEAPGVWDGAKGRQSSSLETQINHKLSNIKLVTPIVKCKASTNAANRIHHHELLK